MVENTIFMTVGKNIIKHSSKNFVTMFERAKRRVETQKGGRLKL